jgi:hypothetical protein
MAIQDHADALSSCAIECRTFWEKTVIPLFALLSAWLRRWTHPPPRANHPEEASSRLSAAFILIRRAVIRSTGGHRRSPTKY